MSKLTSLPLVLAVLAFGSLACGGSASTQNEGGGPSDDGGGGSGAGTSDGAGPVNGGGGSGAGTSDGGGPELPECGALGVTDLVYGCAVLDLEDPQADFEGTVTVTAVRAGTADDVCATGETAQQLDYTGSPDVVLEVTDEGGNEHLFGVRAPGFLIDTVAVDDTLTVDFVESQGEWGEIVGHLRIERDGALVAAIGSNDAAGLPIEQGETTCYQEDDLCGASNVDVVVTLDEGQPVRLERGDTAIAGDLSVTLARNVRHYDISGGCNFGVSPEYLLSAAPAVIQK